MKRMYEKIVPYPIRRRIARLKLFYRFCKTPYWGAWEMVNPLLDYPFEMFCEFYECCRPTKYPDQDEPWKTALEEMDILYNWYTKERLEEQEIVDYLLSEWSLHHVTWWVPYKEDDRYMMYQNVTSNYGEYLFKMHSEKEQELFDKEAEMLIRLMKIRNFCWD